MLKHRKTWLLLSLFLLIFSGTWIQGCGSKEECSKNTDCLKGEECKEDNGINLCVKIRSGCKDEECKNNTPETPYCDTEQGACVSCLDDSQCKGDKFCQQGQCQALVEGCKSDLDCPASGSPKCNIATKQCVTCLSSADCLNQRICRKHNCQSLEGSSIENPVDKKEARPEPKKEATTPDGGSRPEPKPEPKKETKPEPKKETKPEPKKETKPEPKKETKPEPKKEAKPEPKPDKPPSCPAGQLGCKCKNNICNNNGLLCLQVEFMNVRSSYCFQECSNTTLCKKNKDGRTICEQVGRTQLGQPVKICTNQKLKDKSCDPRKAVFCKPRQNPPLYCSQSKKPKTCLAAIVQTKIGAICNKATSTTEPVKVCDSTIRNGRFLRCIGGRCEQWIVSPRHGVCGKNKRICNTKDTCLRVQQNAPSGYCFESCTPGKSCAGGLGICRKLQAGGGACVYGAAARDQSCGNAIQPGQYYPKGNCKTGLQCISFEPGAQIGSCLKPVSSCTASSCTSKYRCISLTSKSPAGACTRSCNPSRKCPTSHRCVNGLCYPNGKSGTLAYGTVCNPSSKLANQRCCNGSGKEALCKSSGRKDYPGYCYASTLTKGYCASDCTNGQTCPTVSGFFSSCLLLSRNNYKICVIPCRLGRCPSGLKCAGTLCLP